jgi:hypothetical protein
VEELIMRYGKGERVALVYTDDPHTALRPGDEGTVVHHDEATATVDVDWDSGSRLSMCLDAGDRIRRLPRPGHPHEPARRPRYLHRSTEEHHHAQP